MSLSSFPDLKNLRTHVHAALRAWRNQGGTPENLLEFLLLVQQRRVTLAQTGNLISLRLATNQILMEGFDKLAKQDDVGARVLRARFPDNNKIRTVANKQNTSIEDINRLQRTAIERLTQILWEQETAAREARAQAIEAHFPPPSYDQLFGLEQASQTLFEQLVTAQAPWVVTIVGIGGIGKTSLADRVARQLIRQVYFEHAIWVRLSAQTVSGRYLSPDLALEDLIARLAECLWPEKPNSGSPTERMVQVRQALKARPYLIIIDNLEAEADTVYLLEHLNSLAEPSKFLLTTRMRAGQSGVFSVSLDELNAADAAALLRHHAKTIGVKDLANAAPEEAESIHQITGGNPLAIKLVVSLSAVLPLPQILADLVKSRPGPVEDLYRHIYWKTWQTLTEEARCLLQAMPLTGESGGAPEQMQRISELSESQLWRAVAELVSRSLLEVRGTTWERRYGIHRLTETFLYTEIIKWPLSDT